MKTRFPLLLLLAGLLAAQNAFAQAAPPASPAPTPAPQAAPAPATGPQGEVIDQVGWEHERGFFMTVKPGLFFTLAGKKLAADGLTLGSKFISNASPMMAFQLGYDLGEAFSLGLEVMHGSSAGAGREKNPSSLYVQATGFTVTNVDLLGRYLFKVGRRLYVPVELVAGISFVAPQITDPKKSMNFNAGLSSGIQWATMVRHLDVGLELQGQFIIGYNIPAISIYPTVRYTF
ncbi:MAG: hypothetical protein GMKNLPBB_01809 [Myxococcota bacterium]|nr:hypothetical protein [Myxococcota bacterium]